MSQVEVQNIVKEYKRRKNSDSFAGMLKSMVFPKYDILRAVNDVSFSIEKGEAIGYVGPNGCGKSTTIKMLCGILNPTEGTVRINGRDPFKERIQNNKKMGVVFGNRSLLWWDVPVIESYRMFQKLYEIPEKRFKENLDMFIDIMGIGKLLSIPERQLSLGQKMRCNIAAAFLHDPEIVFLDEPTIGLDAESKSSIRKFIQTMNEERKTTFLVTSHDFQDIESLCKRIVLINHGKVVVDDNMQNVKLSFNKIKKMEFELDHNPWMQKIFAADGVNVLGITPYSIKVEYDTEITDSVTIIQKISEECEVRDITIAGRDIEEIIREIIKKDDNGYSNFNNK